MSADDTSLPGLPRAGEEVRAPAQSPRPRGRLFRKYVGFFVGLVGVALIVNGGFDFWFGYQENKAALVRVQQEKADAAAQRIEEFVEEIERQIGWTTHAQWSAAPLDQRRFDYVRLLSQVPAITEVSELDHDGKEQLKVSRLAMDVVGSGQDLSQTPAFSEARAHKVWFSPVYFRKESEPYMTLAMARAGRNAGVTVAEVNLKLIWDVITGLKIGQGGYAYVVDGRGRLIAHPDISLVLRDTDYLHLPQVAAALQQAPATPAAASAVSVARNGDGRSVLSAHAAIAPLGWLVFVEVPLSEAFAPLYGAALRSAILLGLGLAGATLAALFLARRMSGPIREMQEGAARIGAGDLDRRIDIHTGDELEALAQQFNHMAADLQTSYAELENKVEERTAELSEALDQQTATAEVLQVINSSPGNLAPVFDAMLEKALSLCEAAFGVLWTYDGEYIRAEAIRGAPAEYVEFLRKEGHRPSPNNIHGRLLGGEAVAQIVNVADSDDFHSGNPTATALVELGGGRTAIAASLRKDQAFLGDIVIYRQEVRPFSDKQIALLQNFAAQAVIAMENARLITETQEALEQQTATAEVLGVINSSPGDLGPVFEAILEKALNLCAATYRSLQLYDGEKFRAVAVHGLPDGLADRLRDGYSPGPDNPLRALLEGKPFVHVIDMAEIDDPVAQSVVELGAVRTLLAVALRKDDRLLGQIVSARREVRPFTEKEIALLQNFAAQAVIAIENARLITETQEALEQQTATAEVLGVINSSPGDLAPVFEAMLEKAHALCGAEYGTLVIYDGEYFRMVANQGMPESFVEQMRQPFRASPGGGHDRLVRGERFVHVPDVRTTMAAHPVARLSIEAGSRTILMVPLRKDGVLLGLISAVRREVRPFSDKEIALLENFAAQAVIAMENARLLGELRARTDDLQEALEYQTATSDVLKVISRSTFDLQPVLDTLVQTAARLCGADNGSIATGDGEVYRVVANFALAPEWNALARTLSFRPGRGSVTGRTLLERQVVQIADITANPEYTLTGAATVGNMRTVLGVPLLREGAPIGVMQLSRTKVEPFSERQIELVRTFANQAVIAIENTRLITETREALDQQTATSEVLQVINSSPGDLAPVFDAMLEKALALCEGSYGGLMTYDGDCFHSVADRDDNNLTEWLRGRGPLRPEPDTSIGRIARGENVIHVPDLREDQGYRSGNQMRRALVDIGGARSMLSIALRKEERLLGALHVYRQEARPFSDKQIALLQNFGAQAVIAMENARLITETREALEQQTATAEVLQVINSSPGDLTPVFDAMLEKAMRLCEASIGAFYSFDGEFLEKVAHRGDISAEHIMQTQHVRAEPGGNFFRLIHGETIVHVADLKETEMYRSGFRRAVDMVDIAGARTAVWVGLRRDETLLGILVIYRQEVRPFTDKQIALLQNFAAQAVIAMENARLITETREALDQQTATAEVLQVINSSPGDLAPVFDAILEKAHSLCGVDHGTLQLYDGENFRAVAIHGQLEAVAEQLQQPHRLDPTHPIQRLAAGEPFAHVPDLAEIDAPGARYIVEIAGIRTALYVALRKEEVLLGFIGVGRGEVRPFADKEIALLRNFAAQAVIAMENARLITETREALDQQTATAEVLGVINSSPGDLAPVFEAMLEKAMRLCEAAFGLLMTYDGEAFRATAQRGLPSRFAEYIEENPASWTGAHRRLAEGVPLVHLLDAMDDAAYPSVPSRRALVDLGGARTVLLVPLRQDDRLLGSFAIYRQEVRAFTDKQIALVQNFAAQAVIAIENARLITETREALEQQTATAEVLQVINSSPGDLAPVFDAMLEKATRLCDAFQGVLWLIDGERVRIAATHQMIPQFIEVLRRIERGELPPLPPLRQIMQGECSLISIPNIAEHALYPNGHPAVRAAFEIGHVRSVIWVGLVKEGAAVGAFAIARREVRPFSDAQIALLQNFAAQAVIAIENARLITETREALDQQTATAEVLQVINSSPGDLAPVFDAMLEKAVRLLNADFGILWRFEDGLMRLGASYNVADAFIEYHSEPMRPGPESGPGRMMRGGRGFITGDFLEFPPYLAGDPAVRSIVELAGARSAVIAPLRKDGTALGSITIYRKEAQPFSEKQLAVLENFAAQAVIAMENARLITETREALDQQTATAEVLQVINASPGDLAPVFDAMLEKAIRLCEGIQGTLWTFADGRIALAASRGLQAEFVELLRETRERHDPGDQDPVRRILRGERLIQVLDIAADSAYGPVFRMAADYGGVGTITVVGLFREELPLGAFVISRREVRPFTEKQIALLQNFAAQAVIAIENARLLGEIRQRQAELRVTFDNMADGVAMFDGDLRLAAWNKNFQELLDLPDDFLAAPQGYGDYIRYLARRGEFGEGADPDVELRRYTERISQHTAVERTRPDGRIVEVRHNPMPEGGFVLIYSDITERKRSETEIRAARDAAEAALRELKTTQASLIQAEKMASLGQLTAGIAHEIKNPLNFVNNFASLSNELLGELKDIAAPAIKSLDDATRAELDETMAMLSGNLDKIAEHGKRADNIVKSMLEHSRGVTGERRAVDLNALVDESLNLAYHGARAQDQSFNITLERDFDTALKPIELVPQDMTRVFLNLFGNGFYAANKRARAPSDNGDGGAFRPVLHVATHDAGDAVEVTVRDNGTGIPAGIRDKLFQPFFTTKPTGEGTGLGLSISYDIVTQQHGGTIAVASEEGQFTEFTIRLPRASPAPSARARP